jgi:hypothetical protein
MPYADDVLMAFVDVDRDEDALRHSEARHAGAFERLVDRQRHSQLADLGSGRHVDGDLDFVTEPTSDQTFLRSLYPVTATTVSPPAEGDIQRGSSCRSRYSDRR